MDFYELLARRRMQRSFLPDPVPREAVERIVRSVRRAPSAGYSQGLSLVVVTDAVMRARIAEGFEADWAAAAPLHVIVTVAERSYHARYNEADKLAVTGGTEVYWPVPFWFVDAGAAMMLLLLAAIEEGLSAAFIGSPDQRAILAELLGIPDDAVPIGLTLIGKSAEEPNREQQTRRFAERRRPDAQVLRWERWEQA